MITDGNIICWGTFLNFTFFFSFSSRFFVFSFYVPSAEYVDIQYLQQYREHSTAQHRTTQHSTAKHSTAQHSTAQHSTAQSPLHKAANQVRAEQSTYRNEYAGLFSWSMELSAFASRLFAPKMLDHLLSIPVHLSFRSIILCASVAGGEAPCVPGMYGLLYIPFVSLLFCTGTAER